MPRNGAVAALYVFMNCTTSQKYLPNGLTKIKEAVDVSADVNGDTISLR
jgi:hypothetical protein